MPLHSSTFLTRFSAPHGRSDHALLAQSRHRAPRYAAPVVRRYDGRWCAALRGATRSDPELASAHDGLAPRATANPMGRYRLHSLLPFERETTIAAGQMRGEYSVDVPRA